MGIEKVIRRIIEEDERKRGARQPRLSKKRRIILEDNKTASEYIHDERKCKNCQFPLAISWPLSYCQGCWESYRIFKSGW